MARLSDVRRLALALPETAEKATYGGNASWIVNKRLFAWERPLGKSDLRALGDAAPSGAILGVRTADLEMKEMLIASDPHIFFTIPHFDGYPAVLIRLAEISVTALRPILVEAWLARAAERAVAAYLETAKRPRSR
jgi:hypothetical protein